MTSLALRWPICAADSAQVATLRVSKTRGNWTEHPKVLELRRRSPFVDLLVRSAANYRVHRTGRNATLVAHFAFLSVFPLLLVFTTILGFVLESYPNLRESIIDSAFIRIPIIGPELAKDPTKLQGDVYVLIIGLVVTLWAGMKAFNVLQYALDDIADVSLDDRPNIVRSRLRSLLGIAIVGGGQVAATVLTGFVGVTGVAILSRVGLILAAVMVNTVVLAASYRWLTSRPQSWRAIAPGAILAGFGFAVLQLVGTAFVGRAVSRASPVYGTFATVIGLMAWLSLHAMAALLGAELNRALPMRRFDDSQPSTT